MQKRVADEMNGMKYEDEDDIVIKLYQIEIMRVVPVCVVSA